MFGSNAASWRHAVQHGFGTTVIQYFLGSFLILVQRELMLLGTGMCVSHGVHHSCAAVLDS